LAPGEPGPTKPLPSRRVLVLSGPNLQRLGKRQPEIYGRETLAQIHERLAEEAALLGALVECRQSNHEGELVTWIGEAHEQGFDGIVINPGAYTHTSYALYDALLASDVPTVEVHLSNPEAREPFRRHSCTAPACVGKVAGFGGSSYALGLHGLLLRLARESSESPPMTRRASVRAKGAAVRAPTLRAVKNPRKP
jgi:3-dehydroquinate dehydratase-2